MLPKEQWQVFAALPLTKRFDGEWTGLNITYYGFFNAIACAGAAAFLFLLLGAINVHSTVGISLTSILLGISIPASRLVARFVEDKKFTATSNGALFIGLIILPWIINILNKTSYAPGDHIPISPVIAACAISYGYGESLGRMACISFGCCYGKRVDQLPPLLQRIVSPFSFSFEGKAKKVAYEGGMEGVPLIPIQAITSAFCFLIALAGTWFYFHGFFGIAFVATITATQIWRFVSETLRADYRGVGKITAYQVMALAMVVYSFGLAAILPAQAALNVSLSMGLSTLWNPALVLFLELLWAGVFIFYGRSKVTWSNLTIHVREDRI